MFTFAMHKACPEMKVVKEVIIPKFENYKKVDIIDPLLGRHYTLSFWISTYKISIVSLVSSFQIIEISFWDRMELSVSYPRNGNI